MSISDMEDIKKTLRKGKLYADVGDNEQASLTLREVIRKGKAIEYSENVVSKAKIELAWIYNDIGDYQEAERLFREAALQTKEHYPRTEATAINGLGSVFSRKGFFSEALEKYQYSLRLRRKLGDKQGEASCLNNIAIVLKYQGNYRKALDFYTEADALLKSIGDENNRAIVLGNTGWLYWAIENPRSELCFRQAKEILEKARRMKTLAYIDVVTGLVGYLADNGTFDEAKNLIQIASHLGSDLGTVAEAKTLYFHAYLEKAQLKYTFAEMLFNSALAKSHSLGLYWFELKSRLHLIEFLLRERRITEVQDHLSRSLKMAEEGQSLPFVVACHFLNGLLYSYIYQFDEAINELELTEKLAEKYKFVLYQKKALEERIRILASKEQYESLMERAQDDTERQAFRESEETIVLSYLRMIQKALRPQ